MAQATLDAFVSILSYSVIVALTVPVVMAWAHSH